MGFLARAADFAGSVARTFLLDSPAAYAFFNILDDGVLFPFKIMDHSKWWTENWVSRRCIHIISSEISQLPLELYKKNSVTKIESHPFIDFMAAPNPYLTTEQLLFLTVAIWELYGEAFWMLERKGSAKNMPVAAWLVHPDAMREVQSKTFPRRILYWMLRTPEGNEIPIDPLDICHFKYPDVLKPFRGTSPLEAAGIDIRADIEASNFNLNFFRNSAEPGGVLETDQNLTPVQVAQVLERWNSRSRGTRNAHKIAVAWKGLHYKPITSSFKDMDFREGRKGNRESICGALGVPPVKLGLLDGATYANSKEQKEIHWTDTIIPILRLFQSTLDKQLPLDRDNIECWFNIDRVEDLQDILNRKADLAKKFFDMTYPLNAINERLDLGMPDVDWGDVGFINSRFITTEDVLEGRDQFLGPTNTPGAPQPPAHPPEEPPPADETKAVRAALSSGSVGRLLAVAGVRAALTAAPPEVAQLQTTTASVVIEGDAVAALSVALDRGTEALEQFAARVDAAEEEARCLYDRRFDIIMGVDVNAPQEPAIRPDGETKKIAQLIKRAIVLGLAPQEEDLEPKARQAASENADNYATLIVTAIGRAYGTDAESIAAAWRSAQSASREWARTILREATPNGADARIAERQLAARLKNHFNEAKKRALNSTGLITSDDKSLADCKRLDVKPAPYFPAEAKKRKIAIPLGNGQVLKFDEGDLVKTKRGMIPIEELRNGDEIFTSQVAPEDR